MLISIIIVNWNTGELLRKCLQSIYENAGSLDKEIIVVDNASSDNSLEIMRSEFPDIKLVANSENLGYAKGNNIGFEHASGDFILLLNPDTEIQPEAIESLLDCLNRHPDASAAAPRLIYPDGRVQLSCRGFPEPAALIYDYLHISRILPKSRRFGAYRMTWFDYSYETEVDQPMASCMMITRRALDDIGGFDTDFPIFFNDVDWCRRSKDRNWKIYFTPNANVIHHVGGSTRQVKTAMIRESHLSLKRFYRKHYRGRISPIIYEIIMLAVSLNMSASIRLKRIVGK